MRSPAVLRAFVHVLAIALAASGCGYTLVRHAGPLADDAPRMLLRTLDNDSTEPGLERIVSEALRREWLRRGRYRLVADPDAADWLLTGRVLPVQVRTDTLSPVVLAVEQTLTLGVELTVAPLRARKEGAAGAALPTATLRESEIFFSSPDLEVGRKNRREALMRVAALVAERAHDAVDQEIAP
ncbi:MAG: LPS assembly lipoprotein LptE [Myxococcota bacterium]